MLRTPLNIGIKLPVENLLMIISLSFFNCKKKIVKNLAFFKNFCNNYDINKRFTYDRKI